ncbi:MAG: hypothetical protein VXZ82_10660 [Planctomycetota bacterium]|nr:hypothetical protein [Planctomycetota bacterium]
MVSILNSFVCQKYFAWTLGAIYLLGHSVVSAPLLASEGIVFDMPGTAIAQPVDYSQAAFPRGGGKLVRIQIPISLIADLESREQVSGFSLRISSPHQSFCVIDSWPRYEAYSDVLGDVSVEQSNQQSNGLEAKLSGGWQAILDAGLMGKAQNRKSTKEKFQRRALVQTVARSGTFGRGYGVLFQFQKARNVDLFQKREIAVLAEVPQQWRADLLKVQFSAQGKSTSRSESKSIQNQQLWLTVYQEGDAAAAAQTREFQTQERSLRALAASRVAEVKKKSIPTVFHRIGVALEISDPRIPKDYLEQMIFGPEKQYLVGHSHRLPIDIRVAILDFWEAREGLVDLSFGKHTFLGPAGYQVAKSGR